MKVLLQLREGGPFYPSMDLSLAAINRMMEATRRHKWPGHPDAPCVSGILFPNGGIWDANLSKLCSSPWRSGRYSLYWKTWKR